MMRKALSLRSGHHSPKELDRGVKSISELNGFKILHLREELDGPSIRERLLSSQPSATIRSNLATFILPKGGDCMVESLNCPSVVNGMVSTIIVATGHR